MLAATVLMQGPTCLVKIPQFWVFLFQSSHAHENVNMVYEYMITNNVFARLGGY